MDTPHSTEIADTFSLSEITNSSVSVTVLVMSPYKWYKHHYYCIIIMITSANKKSLSKSVVAKSTKTVWALGQQNGQISQFYSDLCFNLATR